MLCDRLTLKVRWTNEQFFEWMSQNIEFYCAVYSNIFILINSFFIKYSSISHKIAATFLRSPLNTHKWSNQKWWNFFFCWLYQRMSLKFFFDALKTHHRIQIRNVNASRPMKYTWFWYFYWSSNSIVKFHRRPRHSKPKLFRTEKLCRQKLL